MQFNRLKDGSLQPLPAMHVDTGMGFERLVRVLQGKQSNYDTDVFTGTISAIEQISGKKYDFGDSRMAVAFRVLADHIRAISFTIADGQLPSNTGAGYVIRRILRRAVRYYYSYLDYKQPMLHQLLPVITTQFAEVFPELKQQEEFVARVIREEEEAFLRTLDKGLRKIDDILRQSQGIVNGKEAFELYDTYGFPIDLTRLIASEQGLQIDEAGFEAEMKQQKDRSRAATVVDTEDWVVVNEIPKVQFVGYDVLSADTRVARYRKAKAKGKEQYQIVLETTPFYAESGGQAGDTGILRIGSETIAITDTKKENDLIIHFADLLAADMSLPVQAQVDAAKRIPTTYNHSATHLMHAALRDVLGAHVAQKGSLVNADVLRFDFSHFAKMSEEELRRVEDIVNAKIRENVPVIIREMPKEEALKLGAMALFGEKYGDTVRVVTMDPGFSVELCGGTHVGTTGMIGAFTIVSESAVAAGVRRVEALTGAAAMQYFAEKVAQAKQVSELLKTKDAVKSVEKLMEEKNALEKRVEALEQKEYAAIAQKLAGEAQELNGLRFVGGVMELSSGDALRKMAPAFKAALQDDFVVILAGVAEGKAQVLLQLGDSLVSTKGWDASKMIREHIAGLIKGGGGGQKSMATAGGQDTTQLNKVVETIKGLL